MVIDPRFVVQYGYRAYRRVPLVVVILGVVGCGLVACGLWLVACGLWLGCCCGLGVVGCGLSLLWWVPVPVLCGLWVVGCGLWSCCGLCGVVVAYVLMFDLAF